MRDARALLASIGTSVMLVAAVTLSLLSVSALFALGGFEGAGDASSDEALVLESQEGAGSKAGSRAEPIAVAVVDPQAPPGSRSAERRVAARRDTLRADATVAATVATATSLVDLPGQGATGQPPAQSRPPAPVAKQPARNLGDGVKQLGTGLSSAVAQTGTALAAATAPLSPPVSVVLQQIASLVATLLKGTTDGLGGLLGAQP